LDKIKDPANVDGLSVNCLSTLEVEHLADFGKTGDSNVVPTVIFILATYEDGLPPPDAEWFCKSLAENAVDFRVSKSYLNNINFAVFGLGNSLYMDNFNKVSSLNSFRRYVQTIID